MFDDFKKEMAKEFEMTDNSLMSYYLEIKIKQRDGLIRGICKKRYSDQIIWGLEPHGRFMVKSAKCCTVHQVTDQFFPEETFRTWGNYVKGLKETPARLMNRVTTRSGDQARLGASTI
ncbi:hypothetical protein RJ639_045473 [Escallonia herrerae]|uniref:Uncharacterized protein n=1 Tax=Escallonia herrerae TaxID=1293975 RepID=A0AA89B042_9ASTE|nr:hypothetical protein RJ639_045473 [Escallonia herrerae]